MPQGRDRGIALAIVSGAVLALALAAAVGVRGSSSAGSALPQPEPRAGGTLFTITVTASGGFQGSIGVIDAHGLYQSQSVSGSVSGMWAVNGRSVTVTMQKQEADGWLAVVINGQSQTTTAPYGVVTLSAR